MNLSKDLTLRNGKGFSRSNLTYMRKFYLAFPKCETVSHKLTWSHYFELLKCDDKMEFQFYFNEAEKEGWKVRELKRQMKSSLFQRLGGVTGAEPPLEGVASNVVRARGRLPPTYIIEYFFHLWYFK